MEDKIIEWPTRPGVKKASEKPTEKKVTTSQKGKEISRRNFLIKTAKITGGVGLAYIIGKRAISGLSGAGEEKIQRPTEKLGVVGQIEAKTDFEEKVNRNIRRIIEKNFGHLIKDEFEKAVAISQEMVSVITGNLSYDEMLKVAQKHHQQISQEARDNDFPEELAIGVIFIENGGGEDLESPAGAVGIGQFLPPVAREYGLRVDSEVDERKDPYKSIPAVARKLKNDSDIFGGKVDIGTWLYHAGLGNGYKALQIYYRNLTDVDLGDITELETPEAARLKETFSQLIKEDNLSVHTILQDSKIKEELLSRLEDETELYPYKAVAAAALFEAEEQKD